MWYFNGNDVVINLAKVTAIKIKTVGNKFKVVASYIENNYIEYVIDTFNTLDEAKVFTKEMTNALNGQPSEKLGYAFNWLK